jgi:transcriptional regulator with XRE-family HTH domain
MSRIEAVGGHSAERVLDYQQAGPTVPRMLLGARLRRLREACGISREEAGEAIRGSHSKISRLELARTGFKQRDVADLLTLYGVTDEAERATLLELARQASRPGWWHAYGDVIPPWFLPYLGLEQAADVIRGYEVQFVPGLLQTHDYARAVIALTHAGDPAELLDHRVELRMRRQRILHRPQPPRLWTVIDETALRRPVGGLATMRDQLRHLIDMSRLPHVTIQVMPFEAGGHAAAGGPIALLRLPQHELPDVVYLEQLHSALYLDGSADIDYYQHVMGRLVTEAEPATATPEILGRILAET